MVFANGNMYEGQFADDSFNGQGVFSYHMGDNYVGDFVANRMCGQGSKLLRFTMLLYNRLFYVRNLHVEEWKQISRCLVKQ